eukprot:9039896-Pyramimonas_sp.AAC.1
MLSALDRPRARPGVTRGAGPEGAAACAPGSRATSRGPAPQGHSPRACPGMSLVRAACTAEQATG